MEQSIAGPLLLNWAEAGVAKTKRAITNRLKTAITSAVHPYLKTMTILLLLLGEMNGVYHESFGVPISRHSSAYLPYMARRSMSHRRKLACLCLFIRVSISRNRPIKLFSRLPRYLDMDYPVHFATQIALSGMTIG